MNEINYTFLLAGDKFMLEMYLKQPRFTSSVCRLFTKNEERIQKFTETADTKYIFKKTSRFIKRQGASGTLTNVDLKTSLNKIPLSCFQLSSTQCNY